MSQQPIELPEGVYLATSWLCPICGTDADVVDGIEQPHHCRLPGEYGEVDW